MLYPQGDVKKQVLDEIHAIPPRRHKEDGAGGTTCYTPEET
jgi:hypothetical protein